LAVWRSGNGVEAINDDTLRYFRLVYTGMGDRLRTGKPIRYVTSHPGQLNLLPSAGREMSSGQSTVMLCGGGVKSARLISFEDSRVGGT